MNSTQVTIYTSQLNVTVMCVYDLNGTTQVVQFSTTIPRVFTGTVVATSSKINLKRLKFYVSK